MNPTDIILSRFEQVSSIPRGTKHEEKIRSWLIAWAEELGFRSSVDAVGNLVMYIPASSGMETSPVLILQGHMDMVWQKTPDCTHDFLRDPIRLIRDGDWIKADRTTLGADNGIAIALMMALVEDETVKHPPLVLVLTVEEEFGLAGADYLDANLLTGKTLINLDSEGEGVFTVGCAGGGSVIMDFPVQLENISAAEKSFRLNVSGLLGGHSGEDIAKHRANANKLLVRALDELQKELPIRLVSFKGGTARNAIPRDAEAVLVCSQEQADLVRKITPAFESVLRAEFAQTESGLILVLTEADAQQGAMSIMDSRRFIKLLISLPNGVSDFSAEVEGFVETSNNIGIIEMAETGIRVVSNHRSSVRSRMEEIARRVEAVAELANVKHERTKMFPPWQANTDSVVLKKCEEVYKQCFGVVPKVELSHGGLECGIISDRCGGLDTISLGPTIENPHSPDERLYVPSLQKTWKFLVALLRVL
ncbi:MAG: aminoacyl-histidine dipeptidase [Anaerolineales bacterium]|nr:aminoacyl-histidine dipeptidase [Anaerolineales bacterium]